MGQILIHDLDDEIVARLKPKAELKGQSPERMLRDIPTRAAPLSPDEKVALSRRLRAMSPPLCDADVGAAIRYGRDGGGLP